LTEALGKRDARTELLVCDELGYLALPDGAAELVFQVLSERHERGSLILTTNLPFGEWTKVFPDPRLAKAVVDRLTHRAHIIDTGVLGIAVKSAIRLLDELHDAGVLDDDEYNAARTRLLESLRS